MTVTLPFRPASITPEKVRDLINAASDLLDRYKPVLDALRDAIDTHELADGQ